MRQTLSLVGSWSVAIEQGSKGAEEQEGRGAREQRSEGAGEILMFSSFTSAPPHPSTSAQITSALLGCPENRFHGF